MDVRFHILDDENVLVLIVGLKFVFYLNFYDSLTVNLVNSFWFFLCDFILFSIILNIVRFFFIFFSPIHSVCCFIL